MSTLLAESSQLAAAIQRSRHVTDPMRLPVLGTVANLQLPVLTEKSAQSQLGPMLERMAVAETAHSAPASGIEMLVRIVYSEPEGKAEVTALAPVGTAVEVRESTARHL